MVRLTEMSAVARESIGGLEMPEVEHHAWTEPVPAGERRISLVSTAGLSRRDDKPFSWHARDYRVIARDERNLVMTHVAVDYDRSAWQQDMNAILPLDRLEEMARDDEIGSVADEHYAFMGASDPVEMEPCARAVAERMRQDGVNTVFLIPV